jgi:hypothetical protein
VNFESDPLEPRIWVGWPCPQCQGTGERQQLASDMTGRIETVRCTACINSPKWQVEEMMPLSTFKKLLGVN